MSERQQLERLLSNPNARKMLDLIANAEGVKHGYNTLFGNSRFDDLSRHPNIRKDFKQTDGKKNYTTAAGRYQFLNSTWESTARRYGLKDFSARNQDIAALALMAQKGAMKDIISGNFEGAVNKLGGTWASLPSSPYAQPKKTMGQLGLSSTSPPSQATPKSRFLSGEQIAKVLPQLANGKETQQRFLTPEKITQVLPQLNQQSNRFLTQDQISQVLPQLSSGG